MNENKMAQVAALFGKKIGEVFSVEFAISRYIARSCFFTADGLFCEDRGPCEIMLNNLLTGRAKIVGE